MKGVLLTEAFSHYSPDRVRHRPAFSNELLRQLSSTPSSSIRPKHPERLQLPEPDHLPRLNFRRRKSTFHASKYPQMILSPELDKKMRLIAGYQLLLDLEVTDDAHVSKPVLSPEAKRRPANNDSREFLKLKRSLLAVKKCPTCKKTYCVCQKTVKDKYLSKMTRRFEKAKGKVGDGEVRSASVVKGGSRSPFVAKRKSSEEKLTIKTLGSPKAREDSAYGSKSRRSEGTLGLVVSNSSAQKLQSEL